MRQFQTEEQIVVYINKGIDSIVLLDESCLYREEQYQFIDEVMKARMQ